jgi:hypothetical protein
VRGARAVSLFARTVFVGDFAGLANRLESLNIAFAIRARGGHQVVLDWPELDRLDIAETQAGTMPAWRRLLRHKPREIAADAALDRAARAGTVDLRIFYGEAPALDRLYRENVGRVRLRREAANEVAGAMRCATPVIGVHVRRGDFPGADAERYAAGSGRHVAVPLWWYVAMMDRYAAAYPGVRFFVSMNGRLADVPALAERSDVFSLEGRGSPSRRAGHAAEVHPADDLFALACCSVILATPMSSFSHWAAHVLGPASTAIIPAEGATAAQPGFRCLRLAGQRLRAWNRASKDTAAAADEVLPAPAPPDTAWLAARERERTRTA